MTLTSAHLIALEASAHAAAMSAQALMTQIAALRAALRQLQEENAGMAPPPTCPKCKAEAEYLIPAEDKTFCRKCSSVF